MKEKKVIDYKRTYRSIRADWKRCALYILILILLAFLFLWAHTDDLTKEICRFCAKVLSRQVPGMQVWTFSETYPCYEVTIVKRRFQEISVSVQATFVFL